MPAEINDVWSTWFWWELLLKITMIFSWRNWRVQWIMRFFTKNWSFVACFPVFEISHICFYSLWIEHYSFFSTSQHSRFWADSSSHWRLWHYLILSQEASWWNQWEFVKYCMMNWYLNLNSMICEEFLDIFVSFFLQIFSLFENVK